LEWLHYNIVLINFLNIERLDLIEKHSHAFVITAHVREEITDYYSRQQFQLQHVLKKGIFTESPRVAMEELQLFAKFMRSRRIGSGESSAIACALHGQHTLAMDDTRAI
jgi:predicted nucleic acid-binding protein